MKSSGLVDNHIGESSIETSNLGATINGALEALVPIKNKDVSPGPTLVGGLHPLARAYLAWDKYGLCEVESSEG